MFRSIVASAGALALLLSPILIAPAASYAAIDPEWEFLSPSITGPALEDETGWSVALSANGLIMAVGEPQSIAGKSGQVRVFSRDGGTWNLVGLPLYGLAVDDFFGTAVALSDDGLTLAVGAPGVSLEGINNAGQVSVYRYASESWTQVGSAIAGSGSLLSTGSSLALDASGNRLAVGSPQGGVDSEGVVRVFDFDTSWVEVGSGIRGALEFANAGVSVALSDDGNRVAVGASGANSSTGRVMVFALDDGDTPAWELMGNVLEGSAGSDQFGRSVALDGAGDTLVVGANGQDTAGSNSGQVTVFSFTSSSWALVGAPINGVTAGDRFGYAVAINQAGTRIAAGARNTDSPGDNAGEVRAFDVVGDTWSQFGQTLTGESAGDQAGHSVALAANGNLLAIGAPASSGSTGHVRVFSYTEPTPAPPAVTALGQPGIYVHIAGQVGGPVEGSPVYFGSYKVATSSDYLLSITSTTGDTRAVTLARGVTSAQGNLEQRLTLPALAPGTYTLSFTGRHVFGTGLRLTNTVTVTPEGTFSFVGQNTHGVW
jgi:hypothetical protein